MVKKSFTGYAKKKMEMIGFSILEVLKFQISYIREYPYSQEIQYNTGRQKYIKPIQVIRK